MRLARSVTTCSVAAPAGTITHATRGGRSARTKSSSSVVPPAPSLAIALTFAGSVAYPTTSWPPRIRRRAMFAPILPSPTIPTCMESSSRLDGPAQLAQAGFHIAPEVHAQRPPPARPEDLEVARSEEHTSELQSPDHLVCRLLLEKKKKKKKTKRIESTSTSKSSKDSI